MKTEIAQVRADHQRHTCIEFERTRGLVRFIPMDILGFEVHQMSEDQFDQLYYRPLTDYPVARAAKLYAGYAVDLGGTPEALEVLGRFTTLTQKEIEMAAAKKTASTETKSTAAAAKPAKFTKQAAPKTADIKEAKTKTPKATAATPKKEPGEKRQSAAQMFKDLIMEGKKTDEQIFAAVQKQFGLDDNKKTYVKWYRADLTKKGENPPEAR